MALEDILERKGKGMFDSAFVHEVMAESCTRETEWRGWGKDLDGLMDDARRAATLVETKLNEKDAEAYKVMVMQVAIEVAMSYREFSATASFGERMVRNIKIFIDKLIGMSLGHTYISDRLLNISFEEDVALSKLAEALNVNRDKVPVDIG